MPGKKVSNRFVLSVKPKDGTSVSITSTEVKYATSAAYVQPASIAERLWSVSYPSNLTEGTWLHSRTKVTYSDGNTTTTYTSSRVGANGAAGYNTAPVFLYKRSDTALSSVGFTDTLTYTFTTRQLSSTPNGWSQAIPPNDGNPLYVTVATAFANTATDTIAYNEWSTPVVLAESGAHGLNTAPVFLYRRYASLPTKPTVPLTYTFATGLLSGGSLNNWSQTIPDSDGHPCWVIQATASGAGATDTIETSEWSSQRKLVEDGANGADADYIYLRGTGNNNPANRLVYISSQINQSSYQGYGRGIEIVTVSRTSLAKVESQKFDTYDGTDSGHDNQTAACNAAATYLNSLDNTVFVCITSLDAIGWNDNLIAALKNFGLGNLAYSTQTGRYPFAFLGYKGLQEGYALWQIHGTEATDPHSEVSAYIANGVFMSSKDGEATPVYSLVLDHASIDFRSDATGSFLTQSKPIICRVRKREGSDSESEVSQSGGTYDSYYLRCRRVYRNNTYQSWKDSNTDTITTALALYSDTNTNPVVGVEFCLSKTSSPTSSSIIATASCAVICDGRRGAEGATGKMFYPMGNYDPTVTYTRTGDLVPLVFYTKGDKTDWNAALGCYGNYYYLKSGFDSTVGVDPADGNSNPWQEASSFGVVITQGLFAEFAKMGKGIFSGDYLFSMNGELDSSDYNEGAAWKGYTAYTLFKGDPSVKGISVADGTVLTNNGYKSMVSSGIYLDSGEECVIKLGILDGTTSSNLIHVSGPSGGQISFERWNYASTWSTTYEMGISSGNTYYIRFTASASGTYFISGGRNSSGTSADKIVYHLNRILFKPNWWVDLLTGKMSAARGNFVVDADGVIATNGTFDGLLRARSMETMFADLTGKYRKDGNTYVALDGDTGSPGEYVLGEDVYRKVGSSYVKVDITGIYNFVVGNTVFILPSDSAFISQRVLLFNGNINTAGGTSKGVTVETYEIEGGLTTARYLRGVGKDIKYNGSTNVPSNHVLPSGAAVPLWSFDAVTSLFFVNGAVELIAVPDTEDATLCEWAVVNIGTNCYMIE